MNGKWVGQRLALFQRETRAVGHRSEVASGRSGSFQRQTRVVGCRGDVAGGWMHG